MSTDTSASSGPTRAIADFAFGGRTGVVDVSRPLAWLSPEEMEIDLADPVARRFGDYELIEKIGQGGMGVVYRARQHGLERDVAVKLLSAGPWASEEFVARFRREARSAARMQHPNIVEIYEFGHRDGLNYFSMRLIEGESLAQRLTREGPLKVKHAAQLLRTLAEAMDYAHRLGVLHLDLKPANVLLTPEGVPLIADFGLARRIDAGHDGGTEISGTPSYMAPEQATLESHPLSASTDIYGLGAVLYECLVGRPPFVGVDSHAVLERVASEAPVAPRTQRRDLPLDLEAVCLKCLAKEPAQRYATARALADDLGRFLDGRAVSIRQPRLPERMQRWVRREPRLAGALAIALLALLIGAGSTAWQWRDAVAQRKAAEAAERTATAERDRARTASEIGAYLYVHGEDAQDSSELARGLIEWLRTRWPGDEDRQADALAAFAASIGNEDRSHADELLITIIDALGEDYRRQVISALQAGTNPRRNLYSAMLAWTVEQDAEADALFARYLDAAIAENDADVMVWHVAAIHCREVGARTRCLHPEAAERLVALEPDNMYHWLLLSMAAPEPERKREALREAAKRTQVDDHLGAGFDAYAKAYAAAALPPPPLLARPARVLAPNERVEASIALATAQGDLPIAGWQALVGYCLPTDLATLDAGVRADCLTVAEAMARSEGGLITRMIGVAIVRNLARGTPLAEEVKQIRAQYQYLGAMSATLGARQLSYPAGRFVEDMITRGELVAMRRRIEFFGIAGEPPPGWRPEDPNVLLSARERVDNLVAINDDAARLLARGRHAEALAVLVPAEAPVRKYLQQWQLIRFLVALGTARTGLGDYAAAERDLFEAWDIAQPHGPTSADARACLLAIVAMYTARHRAAPDGGFDARAREWQRKLEEFDAAAAANGPTPDRNRENRRR